MKKTLLTLFISIFLILCIFIAGCDNKEYIIQFESNTTEALETIKIEDIDKFTLPNGVTKEGHIFVGWYLDSEFNNEFNGLVEEIYDYKLYAKWQANTYTIRYNLDGGACENIIDSFEYGDEVILPIPSKEGYDFLGWYEGDKEVKNISNQDYNLIAKWSQKTYTINYDLDGGVSNDLINSFKHNEKIILPIPQKEGFKFLGWFELVDGTLSKVEEVSNKDYNLCAKWEILSFTYKFVDFNGNTILEGVCNYGDSLTPPSVDKLYVNDYIYEFSSWDKDYSYITEDIIIKANYNVTERTSYFIKFYVDGIMILEKEVEKDSKFEEFIPEKDEDDLYSYSFLAWEETLGEEDFFEFGMIVSKDMTLYAVFEQFELKQRFTITYYDERGYKLVNRTVKRGECAEPYVYTKDNSLRYIYEFDGWYFKGLTEEFDFSTPIYDDYELYAKFNKTELPRSEFVLEGKKISILGDSISTFYKDGSPVNSYYSGYNEYYYPLYSSTVTSVDLTWWQRVITQTKTVLGVNNSLSGSSINSGDITSRINTLGKNGKPDIIIIFLGTNDNVNGYHSQYESAYESAIKTIEKLYPDAYIFACKMGYSPFNRYYYTEEMRLNFNDTIEKLAEKYNMGVIEIDKYQTKENSSLYLGDALHPNANGMAEYCKAVIEAFNKFFK